MIKDKRHIIIVFSIVILFIIIGFIVQKILQPTSFGEHGHYRFDAVNEIQNQEIINQNTNTCKECHETIYQLHEKDAHYNVPCIDCHGPGNLHVAYHRGGDSTINITVEQARMEKEYKLEGCLFCHRKLKAKPSDFPQINKDQHFKFLNVTDAKTKCIDCHSPHEPAFLLTDIKQSRIHPIVYKCTDCHDVKPEKSFREVSGHPAIFECADCHKEIVKDFNQKPHHNYVECRTCHLFHKENESAGRIYKNGNAKFCLLCHEKKSFKDEKYPPKIEWPSHVGDKKIISNSNEKICLNCHTDKIHVMNLKHENPHPENWKTLHNEFAKKDPSVCTKCHTTSQCISCHMKNKPATHNTEWRKQHPKVAAVNKSSCETCHTKNGCINCHKIPMPHPKDFTDVHKDIISKQGKTLCYKCHKEDFCKQCH